MLCCVARENFFVDKAENHLKRQHLYTRVVCHVLQFPRCCEPSVCVTHSSLRSLCYDARLASLAYGAGLGWTSLLTHISEPLTRFAPAQLLRRACMQLCMCGASSARFSLAYV